MNNLDFGALKSLTNHKGSSIESILLSHYV